MVLCYVPLFFWLLVNVRDETLLSQTRALNVAFEGLARFEFMGSKRLWDWDPLECARRSMELKTQNTFEGFLNVYVCDLPLHLGLARLPWDNVATARRDGILISYNTLPGSGTGAFHVNPHAPAPGVNPVAKSPR